MLIYRLRALRVVSVDKDSSIMSLRLYLFIEWNPNMEDRKSVLLSYLDHMLKLER
jgi:hypothetical protein